MCIQSRLPLQVIKNTDIPVSENRAPSNRILSIKSQDINTKINKRYLIHQLLHSKPSVLKYIFSTLLIFCKRISVPRKTVFRNRYAGQTQLFDNFI